MNSIFVYGRYGKLLLKDKAGIKGFWWKFHHFNKDPATVYLRGKSTYNCTDGNCSEISYIF